MHQMGLGHGLLKVTLKKASLAFLLIPFGSPAGTPSEKAAVTAFLESLGGGEWESQKFGGHNDRAITSRRLRAFFL